ncbi:MAG: alpha/beta fold hydrolase [Acidimicrobiia bacterium]|nr:alpha/beta fold hydrolase [Acidimicrobiia bacterium]MYC58364.1 alpha/beta fold hydrolase [Acidimicrobiia bacterium]MYG94123.1 alpha/beta fold hydrolase [Acidimicrobiia bacterium]MYI30530.1 alpha/beta fold hydrolase [Acidimicrobiia bacterium]
MGLQPRCGVIRWKTSDGLELLGHLALPETHSVRVLPGVVFCPAFPSQTNGGAQVAKMIYPLADRVAQDMEWAALVPNYRGCGDNEGDFSVQGWVDDVASAVEYMDERSEVEGVWLAGFGMGGALAAQVAKRDLRVRGVACLGTPVDLSHWDYGSSGVVAYARSLGIISERGYPATAEELVAWAKPAKDLRVDRCAAEIAPRPMLVMHGEEDKEVPALDARAIAEAHGGSGLRIISGAGHRLHADPRCIAILLGWLDSQITLIP